MHPAELFRASLALIDSVAACVCRRSRMQPADIEDFASELRLALLANDYAILRNYAGRSTLGTYLTSVAQRMLVGEQRAHGGRWRPSTLALELGTTAVLIERAVRRDRRSIDEILPLVQAIDPSLSRDDVVALEAKLPPREPRPRAVALEPEDDALAATATADCRALDAEAEALSRRTSDVVRRALAALSLEDRSIVRLHFGAGMKISDIARMLRLPQRPLYRRLERALGQIRQALTAAHIDAGSVVDLIGSTFDLDFGLDVENAGRWPTNPSDDTPESQKGTV